MPTVLRAEADGFKPVRWEAHPECLRVARQKGGTMRAMPLPECLGTVVVHRDDAVTCTRDTCPRDLPLETWFSHHTSFVTCSSDDCAYCRFNDPVPVPRRDRDAASGAVRRSRRRGRLLEPVSRLQDGEPGARHRVIPPGAAKRANQPGHADQAVVSSHTMGSAPLARGSTERLSDGR